MTSSFDRIKDHAYTRRELGVGAAGALASVGGAAFLISQGDGGGKPSATETPAPTEAVATEPIAAVQEASTKAPAVIRAQQQSVVPEGMALITSPRLPLFDLASQDVGSLVSGGLPSWIEVGAPVDLTVAPVALAGTTMDGLAATESFDDYEALAAYLNSPEGIGGVTLVPAESVDCRVNVLAIDGFDPVRHGEFGEPSVRIGFVGDVVPGRNVGIKMREYGDYTHPFHKVAATLQSFDLTVANLEGNLSDTIPVPEDPVTFSFIASTEMLDGFKLAGIDAVSLANNHSTWNTEGWGTQALTDTIDAIAAYELGHFGAGRTLDEARAAFTTEVAGKRVAIIGIDGVTANVEPREINATVNESWLGGSAYAGATADTPGTYPYDPDIFLPDIEALAAEHDIVIPYFHYGQEYIEVPPQWAVDGAHAAIDRGATLVVTNHPHVIQGMEIYDGKPIVYSVGNFIFDQMFSVQTRQGLILEIVLRGGVCVGLRTRGVEIEDFCQPRLMSGGEQAAIMDRYWASTDRLAAR